MALFHMNVTQIKRSKGQSAIAAAAYRAGEKLHSEYYGEVSDYTNKGGVICSEILLPDHAPREYATELSRKPTRHYRTILPCRTQRITLNPSARSCRI